MMRCKLVPRRRLLVLGLYSMFAVLSCGGEAERHQGIPAGPIRIGTEQASTSDAEGTPFGRILGLALHPQEGVFVVDRMVSRVHLISKESETLLSFGRSGDGPGELRKPCCPRFGPDGSLWVLSAAPRRLDSFQIENRIVRVGSRVIIQGNFSYLKLRPPTFFSDGRMLVTAVRRGGGGYLSDIDVALEIDAEGAIIDEHALPLRPDDSLGVVVAQYPNGRTITWPVPFGAEHWVVQSRDGSYARTLTSRYEIVHYELDGTVRHRIIRDVEGEPLTNEEYANAEQQLAETRKWVTQAGGSLPRVHPPDVKPVIRQIWFDDDNRLWVRRYALTESGRAQADVFSRDGDFLFRAHWPADVDLREGAIRGYTAWGVRTGTLGEHSLVRLQFREAESMPHAVARPDVS